MTELQYITDALGHKTAVILPIEDYEEMLVDLQLGEVAREAKGQPKRDFDEVLKEMRDNGEIDV